MTLRLTDEQAAELEAIARVENVPIAEEVRIALKEHIAKRRRDRAFQARGALLGVDPSLGPADRPREHLG